MGALNHKINSEISPDKDIADLSVILLRIGPMLCKGDRIREL